VLPLDPPKKARFYCAHEFATRRLAHNVHSFVLVSRRAVALGWVTRLPWAGGSKSGCRDQIKLMPLQQAHQPYPSCTPNSAYPPLKFQATARVPPQRSPCGRSPWLLPLLLRPARAVQGRLRWRRLLPLNCLAPCPLHNPCTPTVSRTFNPLSRVLFIFPSQYLFAIGHAPLFSLGGSLPAALELHSQTARLAKRGGRLRRARASRRDSHPPRWPIPKHLAQPRAALPPAPSHNELALFPAWAPPASFAITGGITVVFFSCP
jgi:hypothetical protein